MVAASGKPTRSPAKRGAGKPSPVIAKAKPLSSPLASPTPSQRSRGRVGGANPEQDQVASPTSRLPRSPTSPRGTPRRGAAVKAKLNMEAAAADEAAFGDNPRRRAKKDDDDYDSRMASDDDAFDEPSFGAKKPPRPRSKPGTPRYVSTP